MFEKARDAWDHADGLLDVACSELAAVPGAADQYHALCRAVTALQKEGRKLIAEAAREYYAANPEEAPPTYYYTSERTKGVE